MTILVGNEITIHNPSREIKKWCKSNLEFANPDYTKKRRLGFWTGNIPKKLILYKTNGETLILPYGTFKAISKMINPSNVIYLFKTPTPIKYSTIPLREYQQNALNKMLEAESGILQAPAGSGKTRIGLALAFALGYKTLWITHTRDLLEQSKKVALDFIDKKLVGTITEGKVDIGEGITFATVQTLCHINLPLYRNCWDVIIVDECHRVAGSATSVTMFSKVLENLSAKHKYGLSATVHRADGLIKTTYALLGQVEHEVKQNEVDDHLQQVAVKTITLPTRISRVCLNTDGTINHAKLINYLCSHKERNESIVKCLVENSEHYNLILSDRIEHLKELKSMLPTELQKQAVVITGSTKKDKRELMLNEMRSGNKRYLFATYKLAKEGLDIPRLDRLYLVTPQKDYATITQSIGRIARRHDDKTDAVAYDFVDDIDYLINSYKKRCTTYRKNGVTIE